MAAWEIIGIIAGAITSTSFIPQIIKGYKTKRLKDVSYGMTVMLAFGIILWIFYGIHLKDIAVIGANILALVLVITLMIMKRRYSKMHSVF